MRDDLPGRGEVSFGDDCDCVRYRLAWPSRVLDLFIDGFRSAIIGRLRGDKCALRIGFDGGQTERNNSYMLNRNNYDEVLRYLTLAELIPAI